ncbi:alpha/beta hydrolase [Spirillospora sp. CA-255316]
MSGDRPTLPETGRPVHGTAAGTAYLALPPTAVDARPSGPTRLVVAWPGFDPPRTAAALAAAMPLTGVPTWRVYLELPVPGGAPSEGLGSGALLEARGVEAYAAAVEGAVENLPAVLAAVRADLGIEEGPVGLAGFSVGASIALLTLARGAVPVSAAALVTPVLAPARAATALERLADRERDWDDRAAAAAERLDLAPLAERIAGRDAAVLLIAGAKDRVVSSLEVTELRDRLREHGLNAVEAATFRMGHAMAAQPGVDAQPPTTEAVRVDGVLNDWFRERLAVVTDPGPGAEETHSDTADTDAAAPAAIEPAGAEPTGAEPVGAEPAARAAETVTQPFTRPAGGSMTGTGAGLDIGADAGHGLRPTPAPGSGNGSGAGPALGMGFGTVRSPMGEYPADLSQAGLGCRN